MFDNINIKEGKTMNRILLGLFGLVILFCPLSGVYVQGVVVDGWDWAITNGGWIVTVAFGGFVVFYFGVLYARMTLKDRKKQAKGIAKAKKSSNTKDKMAYELI